MTFKIERETRWSQFKSEMVESYYVWADQSCIASCATLDEAKNVIEKAKAEFKGNIREIVHEETID